MAKCDMFTNNERVEPMCDSMKQAAATLTSFLVLRIFSLHDVSTSIAGLYNRQAETLLRHAKSVRRQVDFKTCFDYTTY